MQGLLGDQGIGGHAGAGGIYIARRRVFQAGSTFIYSLLTIDNFIDWISKSSLTSDSATLYQEKINTVSVQEKEDWVDTWDTEEISRGRLQDSYGYKTTIAYMPEHREKIHSKLSELSTPLVSSSDKNVQAFERRFRKFALEFQNGESLTIPTNDMTLIFSEWRDYKHLFRFLYYLIIKYQQRSREITSSDPPKILYVDTKKNTFSPKQFIHLSAPLRTLKDIQFTKLSELSGLELFIKKYLSPLILRDMTEKSEKNVSKKGKNFHFIVINSLFDLISAHYRSQDIKDTRKFKTACAKKGTELVRELRKIARKLDVTVVLTSVGATFDKHTKEMKPNLFKRVLPTIYHKIYLKLKRKHYHLRVQDESQWGNQKIQCPYEKKFDEIKLADFCRLAEIVDFTFPSI